MAGLLGGSLSNIGATQGTLPSTADYSKVGAIPGIADYASLGNIPGAADYSKVGAMPSVVDYSLLGAIPQVGQYSQQATDLYNQLAAPMLEKQRSAKEAQMAAMGLGLGSGRAYNTQQDVLNDSENRSGLMAAQAGIQQGNTMFDQALRGYQQGAQNLNNQFAQGMGVRQQGVGEQNTLTDQLMRQYIQGTQNLNNQYTQGMGIHQQGINDQNNLFQQAHASNNANLAQSQGMLGLMQALGSPGFQSFSTPGAYQPANLTGAAQSQYQANLNNTNAQNAARNGMLGNIAGIAGMALGGPVGGMLAKGAMGAINGGGGSAPNDAYFNSPSFITALNGGQ